MGSRNLLVRIAAPAEDVSHIETLWGFSFSEEADGEETYYVAEQTVTERTWRNINRQVDRLLTDCVVIVFKSTVEGFPDLYPGQSITLTDGSNAFLPIEDLHLLALRGISVDSNHATTSRRFLQINTGELLWSLFLDRCNIEGTARALTGANASSHNGRIYNLKIRHCNFTETTHRVFDVDYLEVDHLTIQDNYLYNINSTVFYFPGVPATELSTALVERNNVFCEPEHIAAPNGSYASVGLLRFYRVECRDNRAEGYKTNVPDKSTGSWDLRCHHILSERNYYKNCGAAIDDAEVTDPTYLKRRRILNCKDGSTLDTGETMTGRWIGDTWIIEPEYFQDLELHVPKLIFCSTNYRHIEMESCVINIDELLAIGNDERFIPSFRISNTPIVANKCTTFAPTNGAIFWFEQIEGEESGDYIFDNSPLTIGEVVGDGTNTMLLRIATVAAGTKVTFTNFTLSAPDLDHLFYLHPLSLATEWTFDNSTFTTLVNTGNWVSGRVPNTVVGTIDQVDP